MAATLLIAAAGLTTDDLHGAYSQIFATGNRNAASHLWASYILHRSQTLPEDEFVNLFASFCPVSGSPVNPSVSNTYHYALPSIAGGGSANGFIHHCCAPCVCDTHDLVRSDTKTIELAGGGSEPSDASTEWRHSRSRCLTLVVPGGHSGQKLRWPPSSLR